MECRSNLSDDALTDTIRQLVESEYDLGHVHRIKEILGGYCNKGYALWLQSKNQEDKFFLRLYNPNIDEKEIQFEHALLIHLQSNGFDLAARIIPCRNKSTLVQTPAPEDHPSEKALWALFKFLEGEDKYTWTQTNLSDKEFISAAEILAHLHHCGHDFKKPAGADRVQPPIMPFIGTFKATFTEYLHKTRGRRCDGLFQANFKIICAALDDAVSYTEAFIGMPQIPIHCDYHPGNLKYRDEKGVGLFDFDWSKIDYRLFDLALGLVYFTSIWDAEQQGLRAEKFSLFLNAYNRACRSLEHIQTLSSQEKQNLVPMLSIANLYVLNWDLLDFYGLSQPDDAEYYTYINHNIGLMHWILAHPDALESLVMETLD
jgi:homoserine kinase type II